MANFSSMNYNKWVAVINRRYGIFSVSFAVVFVFMSLIKSAGTHRGTDEPITFVSFQAGGLLLLALVQFAFGCLSLRAAKQFPAISRALRTVYVVTAIVGCVVGVVAVYGIVTVDDWLASANLIALFLMVISGLLAYQALSEPGSKQKNRSNGLLQNEASGECSPAECAFPATTEVTDANNYPGMICPMLLTNEVYETVDGRPTNFAINGVQHSADRGKDYSAAGSYPQAAKN